MVTCRFANRDDCTLLGELNHQLIRDEGHRNQMNPEQLRDRMGKWLERDYRAVMFEEDGCVVGYALFREEQNEIYLRQLFICRDQRRRGLGRRAIEILKNDIWLKEKRLTVEVLVSNEGAVRFWRAVGYKDYALTLEIMPQWR